MKDINKLLEKYWNGETSLEEERFIKKHFQENNKDDSGTLFSFFEQEKDISYEGQIAMSNNNTKQAKIVKINFLKKIAVAASILIIIGIGGFLSKDYFSTHNTHNKYIVEDPAKARKIAEDALAMLASNYVKGENTLNKSMKNFEKVNIINSIIKSN